MVTKGSVLVVDDEVNLCRILGAKLAKSGYNVVAVHDGAQAVEKVRECDFDIVLLDLILPKMDGLTALAKIRGMRDKLPVIIMTACENADALETAKNHGVSAYVNKPFDLDNLVTLVQDTSRRSITTAVKRFSESSILFVKDQPITLEIQNGSGVKVYPSHIHDKDDHTLSVLAPSYDGIALNVAPKTSVRVGLAAGDAYFSFTSRVLRSDAAPYQILVLDKPGVIYRAQRRKHTRFAMRVPVAYAGYRENDTDSAEFKSGETRDLSLGGMSIVVPEQMLPGEMIKVEIRPKSGNDVISVVAQVMRSMSSEAHDEPGHVLGCRFVQSDDALHKLLQS